MQDEDRFKGKVFPKINDSKSVQFYLAFNEFAFETKKISKGEVERCKAIFESHGFDVTLRQLINMYSHVRKRDLIRKGYNYDKWYFKIKS